MPDGSEGGRAVPVLTIVGIIFFLVVVAVLIRSYDTDAEVAAVRPPAAADTTPAPASAPAPAPAQPATESAPVGGVATGAGGTAGENGGVVVPVLAGLGALSLVAAAAVGVRRSRMSAPTVA